MCNALCLLLCALRGQCGQAAVPGRPWEEPATPTPRACFMDIAFCGGRKSPDTGTGKVLAVFFPLSSLPAVIPPCTGIRRSARPTQLEEIV